jgi:membrane protein implicated in regulation of membrane protease activity
MPQVDVNTLNCVYFALFFVGVGYAIFIVITGGLSHIDMPDVHVDIPHVDLPGDVDIPGANIDIGGPDLQVHGIDAPDVTVSPLSPITIASFITTFGGIGVLSTQFFSVDPRLSLVFATIGGLIISGLMFAFYSQVLIRSQGSSEVSRSELIGLEAEVTVPIGESAAGQISYETKAGRMTSIARSVDSQEIGRGRFVRIVRFIGSQALVRPISTRSKDEE